MKRISKKFIAALLASMIVFGSAVVGFTDIRPAYAGEAAEFARIEIGKYPTKMEYYVGESLDTSGMMLFDYNNNGGSFETVTVGYTCEPTVLNNAGTQTITVTYDGKTCTFEVEVLEAPAVSEPATTAATEPATTRPVATTAPAATEPATTRPVATTAPAATEPATTRPESTTKPVISEEITNPDADNKYTLQIRTKTYELKYNQHTKMSAVILPENSGNHTVVWSSSDSSVATVNQEGKVTACGEGEVIISATLVDSNGNVVADRYGNEVSDKVLVKCTMTVWQKIVRFFENLFNAFFTFNAESDMFKTK